jgi:DnaJ-domain-containing protein 1
MTAAAWGLVALVLIGGVALAALRLPPRRAAAVAAFAAALAFALARQIALAAPLAALGLALWQGGARSAPSPGQRSEVRTAGLAMRLDHDSGEMDGEVLAGAFAGARLSELGLEQLQALVAEFDGAGDEDSLSLLLAYMSRRRGPEPEPPPRAGAAMSRAEAYRILGLSEGASVEEVREAYRRLMKRVHPDLGGSSALAAMLNAAKELLDPG